MLFVQSYWNTNCTWGMSENVYSLSQINTMNGLSGNYNMIVLAFFTFLVLLNCEIHKIKVHKLPSIILIKVKLMYFFVFFYRLHLSFSKFLTAS